MQIIQAQNWFACIKFLGGSKRRYATIGDVIIVSVKEAIPNTKVSKGTFMREVIVQTAKRNTSPPRSYIKFDEFRCIDKWLQNEPIGMYLEFFGPGRQRVEGQEIYRR